MSSSFTNDQLTRFVGDLQQRIEAVEALLDQLAALLERQERRLTTLEIVVLDRDDDPSLN